MDPAEEILKLQRQVLSLEQTVEILSRNVTTAKSPEISQVDSIAMRAEMAAIQNHIHGLESEFHRFKKVVEDKFRDLNSLHFVQQESAGSHSGSPMGSFGTSHVKSLVGKFDEFNKTQDVDIRKPRKGGKSTLVEYRTVDIGIQTEPLEIPSLRRHLSTSSDSLTDREENPSPRLLQMLMGLQQSQEANNSRPSTPRDNETSFLGILDDSINQHRKSMSPDADDLMLVDPELQRDFEEWVKQRKSVLLERALSESPKSGKKSHTRVTSLNQREQWRKLIPSPHPNYIIELGDPNNPGGEEFILEPGVETPYFTDGFYKKNHTILVGKSKTVGPVFLCIDSNLQKDSVGQPVKVLARTKKHDRILQVIGGNQKKIIQQVMEQHPFLKSITNWEPRQDLSSKIVKYEEKLRQNCFKFGVLYVREGQVEENDIFGNRNPSPQFEEFLSFLGSRIKLEGWKGFAGGLSTRNATGTHSVFTKFENYNIMFHVSTLLPYSETDAQQLERKRHIGNDIVVIVFLEGGTFDPKIIVSEVNHVFLVVSPVAGTTAEDDPRSRSNSAASTTSNASDGGGAKGWTAAPSKQGSKSLFQLGENRATTQYQVAVAAKLGVSAFGPTVPFPPTFKKDEHFRNFLLTKMINAERSSMLAPGFANALSRTREALMEEIISSPKS